MKTTYFPVNLFFKKLYKALCMRSVTWKNRQKRSSFFSSSSIWQLNIMELQKILSILKPRRGDVHAKETTRLILEATSEVNVIFDYVTE